MRIDEYLDAVCGEIRWKAARAQVREEVRAHIEQRIDEYVGAGEGREQAEAKAVANMGDAAKTGRELDKLHRPSVDWILIGALFLLLLTGVANALLNLFATLHSWAISTVVGIAAIVFLSFFDIRALFAKKALGIILYFVCLCAGICIFSFFPAFMGSSLLPSMLTVGMLLSAGILIAGIKSYKGFFTVSAALFAGAVMLLMIPAFSEAVMFSVCAWFMMWKANVKKKAVVILTLTALLAAVFALSFYLSDPYRVMRLFSSFTDPKGAGYVFWQIKCRVANLNWFGMGTASPDIETRSMFGGEFALTSFMWRYGAFAGFGVVALCGVVMWRVCRLFLFVKDNFGRVISLGLSAYVCLQIAVNLLTNFGALPTLLPSFIPMFSQVWSQTLVFGCVLGLLIGLYRRKDLYKARAVLA